MSQALTQQDKRTKYNELLETVEDAGYTVLDHYFGAPATDPGFYVEIELQPPGGVHTWGEIHTVVDGVGLRPFGVSYQTHAPPTEPPYLAVEGTFRCE